MNMCGNQGEESEGTVMVEGVRAMIRGESNDKEQGKGGGKGWTRTI